MISPLIVEEVRLKLVSGAHTTTHGRLTFSCGVVIPNKAGGQKSVPVTFGFLDTPTVQWAGPKDLRELSALFLKMAEALEAK